MDMFGKKKEDGAEPGHDEARGMDHKEPVARPAPRPGPSIPGRPTVGPSGPAFDSSNRPISVTQQRGMTGGPPQGVAEEKKLIVGNHIRLKGEVTSCDTMIVEGQVELSRSEARLIQISPTGVFLGDVEVDEADISGRFEGGLTARDRLIVRASGEVTGRIRYGKIIVESGGSIAGEIGSIDSDTVKKAPSPSSLAGKEARKDAGTPSSSAATEESAKEKAAASGLS